ncbi:g11899 [Coccomyxa viridis]|uniref:G11899 protein n=1 Tax=Coccomyxa viridis TaxID=1274662 RepID=A0ABP1GD66_9CHLO
MTEVLFVEVGFGCDGHGQNVTKAATRACRNAIEFNSLPAMGKLIPGGYAEMRLHIKIGTPHPEEVDVEQCKGIFPYGLPIVEVVEGGLSCGSGIAVDELGDSGDEMCVAVAAVTVGYGVP